MIIDMIATFHTGMRHGAIAVALLVFLLEVLP